MKLSSAASEKLTPNKREPYESLCVILNILPELNESKALFSSHKVSVMALQRLGVASV